MQTKETLVKVSPNEVKLNISLELNRIKICLSCHDHITGNLYHLCQVENGLLGSVCHKAVQFLQDEADLNFVLQLNIQGDCGRDCFGNGI